MQHLRWTLMIKVIIIIMMMIVIIIVMMIIMVTTVIIIIMMTIIISSQQHATPRMIIDCDIDDGHFDFDYDSKFVYSDDDTNDATDDDTDGGGCGNQIALQGRAAPPLALRHACWLLRRDLEDLVPALAHQNPAAAPHRLDHNNTQHVVVQPVWRSGRILVGQGGDEIF